MQYRQKDHREFMQRALTDPAAVFDAPQEVLEHAELQAEQKIEILKRWEYDARELQVAEEENMQGKDNSNLLDRVLDALHQLKDGPDLEHSPPTKQGGV